MIIITGCDVESTESFIPVSNRVFMSNIVSLVKSENFELINFYHADQFKLSYSFIHDAVQ